MADDISVLVNNIIEENCKRYSVNSPAKGFCYGANFELVNDAVSACKDAFNALDSQPLKVRQLIIDELRVQLDVYIPKLSEDAHYETQMGNIPNKIQKNHAALHNTPGTEDLRSTALTGDDGLTLFEHSPYGVIGAIAPSTNPTETIINNTISMVAAGNTIIFSPHPGAKNISMWLISKIEEIVFNVTGIHNVVVCVNTPTFDTTKEMMEHADVRLLAVTGGPGIVNMAMKTGKKVIGAGEGNPPTIVDATADISTAAQDIIDGASFDYNLPCIAEKSCVAVSCVADELLHQFAHHGAWVITNSDEKARLMSTIVMDNGVVNKDMIGRSPATILKAANIEFTGEPRLVVFEVAEEHPLLYIEQLMPVLPMVRTSDFNAALSLAVKIERGCLHTATMHSRDIYNLNTAARALRTSIFVKNAPSYAGIGVGGEGFTTFTIATPTGEGTTSATTFTRSRRCVLNKAFNVR
ncbi:aldehyde dehydrogenase EutE [Vibrio sinensis]|uniref:Aldehyde dehydrogenase EutE n=1 Tax=Vibrio sinensis TaxID=2302434 RepID=A0A3A6QQK6_9VIBR|nr:aldehyde dehydrogenase family protein [Vibrio sinensis]RJX75190.1 aldehyde dehydrogenase EutE [Vibrio sinensis]